ncbi:NADH-quinone oxidoreductase subunit H [Actinomadura keratinilytica]
MADSAPLWAAAALPLLLAPAALAVACADSRSAAPVRAVLRLLVQQPRRTRAADTLATRTGTVLLPLAALLAAAVVPLGATPVSDLGDGVVWFNAMEALAWAAVWLTGWGPNSTPPRRRLPLPRPGPRLRDPAHAGPHHRRARRGSLRVTEIADAQRGLWFAVWMLAAFALYLLSAAAMSFWGPFGQPAGRDLAGGVAAELTGTGRLLLLGGRRLLLLTSAAMAVPLFLGGGHGPLLPGWAWTLVKTGAVLALLLWLRRRCPGCGWTGTRSCPGWC